jgi:hypothetical protein
MERDPYLLSRKGAVDREILGPREAA